MYKDGSVRFITCRVFLTMRCNGRRSIFSRTSVGARIARSQPWPQECSVNSELTYLGGMCSGRDSGSLLPRSAPYVLDVADQCGVGYAVIQALKGESLPGSAKYYIHNWERRLRDEVIRPEAFTRTVLGGENAAEVPRAATFRCRTISKSARSGAEGQNRTVDTSLFRT